MRCMLVLAVSLCAACGGSHPAGWDAGDGDGGGNDAALDGSDAGDGSDGGGACATLAADPTDSPARFGRTQLADALRAAGSNAVTRVTTVDDPQAPAAVAGAGVTLDSRPESYVLFSTAAGETWVVGQDEVGAMYGALDLAERVAGAGPSALPLASPVSAAPASPVRGANFFMTLPEHGETCWWFRDPAFWTEYLDMLARARINTLNLHGMYSLENTIFPNALLYFSRSASLPTVGVPDAERAANLAALHAIVAMAAARGVRVDFMSYRSDTSLSGDPEPNPLDETQLQTYTREAVEYLARAEPNLWHLGFRIGESQHDAAWYVDTFVAGLRASGTGMQISLRTWMSSKPEVMNVVTAAGEGVLVEAKYNGEQVGAPYVIHSDILLARWWHSYFYEDYLQEPAPYDYVYQVWHSGTHRFFRQASYERARRLALTLTDSPHIRGATLQPGHAYDPQREYYHVDPADRFSPFTFRRDEMAYLMFGHLAYDPATPESVFRTAMRARTQSDALWDAVQAASEVVPWIQTAHTCDPDSRGFAPDLEWGGPVRYFASEPEQYLLPDNERTPDGVCYVGYHGPYDPFSIAAPFDAAQDLVLGRPTTRVSPLEVARRVLDASARARAAVAVASMGNPEARDYARESLAIADLGDYFGHKLRAASALAVYRLTGSADYLSTARSESALAVQGWAALARDAAYVKPFPDKLRMSPLGYEPYHWSMVADRIAQEDPASIDALVSAVQAAPPDFHGALPAASAWLEATRPAGPGLASITADPSDPTATSWQVTVRLAQNPAPGTVVTLWWKPWRTDSTWQRMATTVATTEPRAFTATVTSTREGAVFAAEVVSGTEGWRYPDPLVTAPYVVLPAR